MRTLIFFRISPESSVSCRASRDLTPLLRSGTPCRIAVSHGAGGGGMEAIISTRNVWREKEKRATHACESERKGSRKRRTPPWVP